MGGLITILARGSIVLGGAALTAIGITHASLPQRIWLEAGAGSHILAAALLSNLLFMAFPFRRRNDLALALAIVLMGIDLSARVPLEITFSDAAGAGLAVLQVWIERLRAGARQAHVERRNTGRLVEKPSVRAG